MWSEHRSGKDHDATESKADDNEDKNRQIVFQHVRCIRAMA